MESSVSQCLLTRAFMDETRNFMEETRNFMDEMRAWMRNIDSRVTSLEKNS